ncbi:MAG: hypothetical protein L6420_07780 [Elusimicrobia bacterium]|nr:hypothetical protein [Elusimicrobiota bacterium]
MISTPIFKVISVLKEKRVKSLLIGGQACIIYGGSEFSRDSDFVILSEDKNLEKIKEALCILKAEAVYFPKFEKDYLERGHACHFRCKAKIVKDFRVDIMSKLRNCDDFPKLWKRKKIIRIKGVGNINIISLEDLVKSKKTQRDKDWLMITRLVESDIIKCNFKENQAKILWWMNESRVTKTLIHLCELYPKCARKAVLKRKLLNFAIKKNEAGIISGLKKEEMVERKKDIKYWMPLKKELESLRLNR